MQAHPLLESATPTISRWFSQGLVDRFWSADPTVWFDDAGTPELGDRLGWLDLHTTMRPALPDIERVTQSVRNDSDHVVLCGMGGSSLAPEVFSSVFGSQAGYPDLLVLDSTHPDAVRGVRSLINPDRTTFVISSKSGTTLETLSFFRYFYEETGGNGARFIAVTDPRSKLGELAAERGFRAVFEANPNVGGRFSALTHFGLVPAALTGIDIGSLLDSAAALAASAGGDPSSDPAIGLGIALGEAAARGIDKLTVVTSPSLVSFPAWMEQLVAESLGKDGKGIVPVADEPIDTPEDYGSDRVFLSYQLAGDPPPPTADLEEAGYPVISYTLASRHDVAAEMLRAEAVTAVAGAVMGVHPFNQPNVEAAKNFARSAMSGDLDLQSVKTLAGAPAVAATIDLIGDMATGDYFGVHAYLSPDDVLWSAIGALRSAVRAKTKVATTAGWGPRFLHSTGQLHKGGAAGTFLQLVDTPAVDLAVPESDATFGEIIAAQSAGDFQALVEAGRSVVRVEVGEDPVGFVRAVVEGLA